MRLDIVTQKGLFGARKAIMHYAQEKHIKDVQMGDIFIGNGVSELIVMSMQALLNDGDEVLIPFTRLSVMDCGSYSCRAV